MMSWVLVILVVVVGFGVVLAAFRGAPYLPILKRDAETFWRLSELTSGQSIIDLGSGDGRLLRQAGSRGIHGIGYEINPVLYLISRVVCWRYRKLITIHLGDFWTTKLPEVDVIYVFLIGRFMSQLETKLLNEIGTPTVVISHAFELPNIEPDAKSGASFRYNFPKLESKGESS